MTEPKEPASDETEPIATPSEGDDAAGAELDQEQGDEGEEEEEADEEAGLAADAGAAAAIGSAATLPGRRDRAPKAARTVTPATIIDPSIKVTDRPSQIFVIATVLVFVGIFLYGALAGTGGFFTPYVAPTPSPSPIATPSPSIAPSGSPAASGSPSASGSPAASAAPSGSPAAGSPASS